MAKHKEEKTNVMRILDQKKIPYTARFLSLIHISTMRSTGCGSLRPVRCWSGGT